MRIHDNPFGLRPEEALQWFREKGYRLTFDWRDMWAEAHARAFTVAKATQLDMLADLRAAVDRAIAAGESRGQFRQQLRPVLQQKGWWGEAEQVDPVTGERRVVQLGSARRLDTILGTNRRQAMAAARWERIERTAKARPYLRYVCTLDGRERAEHRAWHGIILPWDDPWWDKHYPPNGWGCRCTVMQLSDGDLRRYGLTVTERAPRVREEAWANERTGQIVQVPRGVDPGFDYHPGKARRGWAPPDGAPVLHPVKTFADYRLPPAAAIETRSTAPERWPIVDTNEDAQEVRKRWQELFGGDEGEVRDPTGDSALFSGRYLDHLLLKASGPDKARASFVPQARQTIEDPYEIWLIPHRNEKTGHVTLRKRYIGLYDRHDFVVVADRQPDGYVVWTSYPKDKIDSLRVGQLLYARAS